ncbi:rod-binding protein [Sphingobium sp. AN641]|uniref:rod-binding protein n=1 Tax=Sphingobium sp. AN641 TaxID=3133443 RepID=UPI0030BB28DC
MQIGPVSGAGSPAGSSENKAALAKTAQAFEAIFVRQMIGAMRSASLGDGMFDSGATEQFRDMADAKTADAMAATGSLGIAELLLQQFGGKAHDTPDKPA